MRSYEVDAIFDLSNHALGDSTARVGPLSGLRVVEICSTIAGPACARLLGDFGAEVTKIEPLTGDGMRQMGGHVGDVSLYAATLLRNKRSVAVDLRTEAGREIALALICKADILVENNRPGVMERLGLGYDVLSAANPGLIMVRISGYGQDGPYSQRPGYGAICEAFGGVRHMTGDPDRPPARVALATTDYLTAVYAAMGALLALQERHVSGHGQVVDTALYETAFSQMESYVPTYEKTGFVPARVGPNLPTMAPNSLYPTADQGWILIAANSDAIYARLVGLMGRPDLLVDARFSSIKDRGRPENMRALDSIIGEWTSGYESAELETMLRQAEVPTSRIYTIADIYQDPHYAARQMIVKVPYPKLGHTMQAGVVPKLSRTPGSVRCSGPDTGANTQQVLEELGYSGEAIQRLLQARVIGMTTT
jgi:crotonobetainyl-CoA:carnitine CoA-transferase CaiB-like acyl-CoA transferase